MIPDNFNRLAADRAKNEAMDIIRKFSPGRSSVADLFGMLHSYEASWYIRLHEIGKRFTSSDEAAGEMLYDHSARA